MKNKKGILEGVIILVGLAIIALILISILVWGLKAIFYGAAIFIFLIALIISIKRPKLFATPLPYVLVGLAIMCAFMPTIFKAVGLEVVGIGDYVCPIWARLECAKSDIPIEFSERVRGKQTYLCNQFVDECYFDFIPDDSYFSSLWYKVYDGLGNKIADVYTGDAVMNLRVPVGGEVTVDSSRILGITSAYYITKLRYYRYGLYSFFNGAKDLVKSGDCSISDRKTKVYGEDYVDTIPKGRWVNYVNKWVYCLGTNYHNHPEYGKIYCEGAGWIYKPAYFDTADGKRHYIGESDYKLPSYSTVSLMPAEQLPKEDCCPGQVVAGQSCGSDFKWHTQPGYCQADIDCSGGGQWYCDKLKTLARYQCVNNKCTKITQTVECCQDADCLHLGVGFHCKSRTWECEQDVPSPYCGDSICQATESQSSCCNDCGCPSGYDCINNICTKKVNGGEEDCITKGGRWVEKTKQEGGIPCKLFKIGCTEVKTGKCYIPHVSIIAIIFIVLGIVLAIAATPTGLAPLLPIGIIIAIAGAIMQILAAMGLA